MSIRRLVGVGLALAGCGLERLDLDAGGASGVPPAVQERFSAHCAVSACHDGTQVPNLMPGASDAIIGMPSTVGTPYVELGNVAGSQIAVRMLPLDNFPPMPPPAGSAVAPDGAQASVIIGWIAGVPFADTDGDTDPTDTAASTTSTTTGNTTIQPTTDDSAGSTGGMDTGAEPTWANVEAMIITPRCAIPGCHNGATNADDELLAPPVLNADVAHSNLVDQPALNPALTYVTPNDTDASYLWHKVNGTQGDVNPITDPETPGWTGVQMPVGLPLTAGELELIEAWINAGAPP